MVRSARGILEISIVGLAVTAAVVPLAPAAIERWFSIRLYPVVQRVLTPLSNLLPFAVFDVLVGVASIAVAVALVRAVRRTRQSKRAVPMIWFVRRVGVGAAAAYVIFLLLWGLNYRRLPMTERLVVDRDAPAPESVVQLGLAAAERLNALYDEAHSGGWREAPLQDDRLRSAFAAVQRELSDAPPAVPGRLKPTLFGTYFRWVSVDGMINPFGLEVLANPDLLPFERPFIAAHEWAHLAGYADEAEASFVGWLACVRGDVEAQYSGWLALYWQVNSELLQGERARLAEALGSGPRRDIQAVVARVRAGQWPWLQGVGWRMYDRYLKANRVEEGVRSYGAVVTLILRARFDEGWSPVRRAG